MAKWTKESALRELAKLADELGGLRGEGFASSRHTSWLMRALTFLEEVFGRQSPYFATLKAVRWYESGEFIVFGWDYERQVAERHHRAYVRDLGVADGILDAAVAHLERSELESVYRGKNTPAESSAIIRVINLAEHKLRKVIRAKPDKEREVQDAFENLLIGADITYSREKETIPYSSKAYIPDFTLSRLDLAVDIKLCGRAEREKQMIGEINDDIMAYQTKYGNALFIVYDLGYIRDVTRFVGAFEQHPNVIVKVVKH